MHERDACQTINTDPGNSRTADRRDGCDALTAPVTAYSAGDYTPEMATALHSLEGAQISSVAMLKLHIPDVGTADELAIGTEDGRVFRVIAHADGDGRGHLYVIELSAEEALV